MVFSCLRIGDIQNFSARVRRSRLLCSLYLSPLRTFWIRRRIEYIYISELAGDSTGIAGRNQTGEHFETQFFECSKHVHM